MDIIILFHETFECMGIHFYTLPSKMILGNEENVFMFITFKEMAH